jgi:NADPH:quinone reductase
MRAARMTRYGPPELLTVTEVADPLPGPGEVAAGRAASGGSGGTAVRSVERS